MCLMFSTLIKRILPFTEKEKEQIYIDVDLTREKQRRRKGWRRGSPIAFLKPKFWRLHLQHHVLDPGRGMP